MEKLNSLQVVQLLRQKGLFIFTPLDFQRVFRTSFYSAKNFIHRHTATGLFTKIRNGLYVLSENKPPKFILANKLYQPSYISFESALSYYHIIPESIYTIFSATPKVSRTFDTSDTEYIYHRIKKELFFDYRAERIDDITFLIAEPAKALVDYLYFVDLKKKSLNERIDVAKFSKKDAVKIAKLFRRKTLLQLLDKLYDK